MNRLLTCSARAIGLLLLLPQTAPAFCDEKPASEFRPLFNGQDLSGWVLVNTPPQTWTVNDGMLVCSGRPIGEIRTDRMYQNFILELEWRHLVPRGNAGVFVWADDITARGVPFHRSIEVQVLENGYGQSAGHTTHGDIFPIHGATMTPVNGRGGSRAFPTEERSKPSPEWNHYRIECRDGSISLAVNGKVVTQGHEASPRKGYICLESEGGVVHYRNLRIQELPENPIDAKHVAVANRDYRSLYTGLDLSGWKLPAHGPGRWKVQDWMLAFVDDTPATDSRLSTSQAFADFGFVMDVRDAEGFRSLQILFGDEVIATINPGRQGQWRRVEGTIRQQRVHIAVDGQPVVENGTVPAAGGALSLRPSGSAAFANLYVRSLSR